MNQDESESPTILQKIKQCKSPESFKKLVTQIGLEPILECISQQNSQFWALVQDKDIEMLVESKIHELNGKHFLGYLKHGSWKKIPLLLLKQRPEIFDDPEFLNRFLEIFEGFLEEVALGDIFQDETLEEILSILLKDNKNPRSFLDAIIRSDPIVLYRTQDDAKEKIVSNPAFQEGVAEYSWEYSDIFIINCARHPDFTKSKLINDAVEKQKEIILKGVQSGFYISDVGVSYPWDIYWLSQYPSLETEILDIMEKVKACVAHACYVEGMYYEAEYALPHPTKVVERIIDIPIFLRDPDIQLGIAKAIRTNPHHVWIEKIKSNIVMKTSPLILAAFGSPISEELIQTLVQQIKERKVPLLVIQEVLANKQFRKQASVMEEVNKRIPEIVSMIENAEYGPKECAIDCIHLILYLVDDSILLEYPEIKTAIKKRLLEIQKSGYWFPDFIADFVRKINEKLIVKKDLTSRLWETFPDISSLSFILGDGLHVVETASLPEEFHDDHYTLDYLDCNEIDLESHIRIIAESGGENIVRILLLILDQLIKQVSDSTYVYARIAAGYDNFTPGVVWCRVLDWVIVHLREKHDELVIRPLIEVLAIINEYADDEWLSGAIFRILEHYMSYEEINTLMLQYEQKKLKFDFSF